MNKEIIIVGAFHEVIELAESSGYLIKGLIDNSKTGKYLGYEILGNDSEIELFQKQYSLVITPDKPELRYTLFNYYKRFNFIFGTIISNEAKISKSATIKNGTIIQYGVNISAEVQIGRFVKCNTYSNIMHNSIIGDFSTIAPNSLILGNVKIGDRCYIGSNATILPNIKICDEAIIGAGAVVTKNITKKGIFIGNPAKELKK